LLIILLPGLDGTGDLFEHFIAATPGGFETKVIAYPHDEQLTYPDCVDFIRNKLPKTEPFLLLGESFSGPVSILAAAESPVGLKGLVLCNTFAVRPAWAGFKLLPWKLAFSFPFPSYKIGLFLVGSANTKTWAKPIRDANRKATPLVHAHRMRSALSVDVRDSLASVDVPILYLQGTKDRLVWSNSLRRILKTKPDVFVSKIDAPHLVLQIARHESWQAIKRFCSQQCVI
jgi:pimeloyl-[acyl-carrier protein] methyl ester esterase